MCYIIKENKYFLLIKFKNKHKYDWKPLMYKPIGKFNVSTAFWFNFFVPVFRQLSSKYFEHTTNNL